MLTSAADSGYFFHETVPTFAVQADSWLTALLVTEGDTPEQNALIKKVYTTLARRQPMMHITRRLYFPGVFSNPDGSTMLCELTTNQGPCRSAGVLHCGMKGEGCTERLMCLGHAMQHACTVPGGQPRCCIGRTILTRLGTRMR